MLVVREQDDLGPARDLGQGLEGGGGALVVELDQDVVDDQGDRLVALEVGLQAGQAEGQVELVGGPQAQALDADRLGRRRGGSALSTAWSWSS